MMNDKNSNNGNMELQLALLGIGTVVVDLGLRSWWPRSAGVVLCQYHYTTLATGNDTGRG
jgi:hypothetical protein